MDTAAVWEQTVATLSRAPNEKAELGGLLATAPATAPAVPAAAAQAAGQEQLPPRSGSWQAAQVDGLREGMLGEEDLGWRTEPVTAPLDVPAVAGRGAAAGADGSG